PTVSHEYILMLTKSDRYYWDPEAVREPSEDHHPHYKETLEEYAPLSTKRSGIDGKPTDVFKSYRRPVSGRNLRSVWEFATQPFSMEMCLSCKKIYQSMPPHKICACGAKDWLSHFAVFPEKLPELCIKAATPEEGCCSKCGAPMERVTETHDPQGRLGKGYHDHQDDLVRGQRGVFPADGAPTRETTGWQPTCKCNAGTVPSLVLDPFSGAGTTLWVAKKLNRKAVGYELSEEYCALARERNKQGGLL
ncbi:hypothetical protein LCGC14_1948200, partial [marine sediment metagenome]